MNQTNHMPQNPMNQMNQMNHQNQNQHYHRPTVPSTTNLQTWTMKKQLPKITTTILEMTGTTIVLAPEAYLL